MSEEKTTRETRLEKLARLRELGYDPYLVEKFDYTHSTSELISKFDEFADKQVKVAGRIVSIRLMGKTAFMHINEDDVRFQIYFKKDDLGEDLWEVSQLLDIGDHIGATGELFLTKSGEKSLHAREILPLSKSLQVLPIGKEKDGEQWYGLTNIEHRYRHRHLDLSCNHEARKSLINRMKMVSAVRRFLDSQGYLEVETPFLQTVAGGAAAKPFMTHYNAYDLDVKLRISLELYLKRLICGDIRKVYELGRVFRNEGISSRHNPEFTMLELYEAYANLEDMMALVEKMFRQVAIEVFGSPVVEIDGNQLDFSKPWRRAELLDLLEEHTGYPKEAFSTFESALDVMHKLGLNPENEKHLGGAIEKLLERFVEPKLIQPTFVIGYPLEVSPLAKKDPNKPGFTRRFEGYICGREICNSFSEINDPIDQRERFVEQMQQREHGNEEAHPMDEDFLYAMEGGMPPTGGVGIGIDRMAMILTGSNHVREILLFPMMKPESK